MTATPPVLILYNQPRDDSEWALSQAGVLAEVQAVADALSTLHVPFRRAAIQTLTDLPPVLAAACEPVVLNLVEELTPPGEANHVTALCRAMGKCTTGCDAIVLDKYQSKAALIACGVPTPDALVVPCGARIDPARLPAGELIVKPLAADGSEGISADSVVDGPGPALDAAVATVHRRFAQGALIEQFVAGREVNVALLQCGETLEVLALAEIDFSAFEPDRPRILDYASKWQPETFQYRNTPRKIPADVSPETARKLHQYACAAFDALGCNDYARVDFRIDHHGNPLCIEVNPNPDISLDAGYAAALTASGRTFADFVQTLLENAAGKLPSPPAVTTNPSPHADIRRTQPADRDDILNLLAATECFRSDELEIAREVLDDALRDGPSGDYQSYTAHADNHAVGWVCFGPVPCTQGTFDLYWIAVAPGCQGRGIGLALEAHAESLIRHAGGRLVIAETSSQPRYAPTRQFYLRCGYHPTTRLPDFYAPADDRIDYVKHFPHPR